MVAFAYLRKSVLPPGATSMSPQAQEDAVRALAAIHGDVIDADHILADWDVSGSDKMTAKRKGYQQLLAAIEDGRATAVYSYSLSRLARSVPEVRRFFDLATAKHVPVRLVADSIDTSTASGKMMLNMLASVAEFESDVASERRLAANQAKRDRGEVIVTDKPFGQKPGEDAEAVIEAFRRTRSYSGAARLLDAEGVKPRRSKTWRVSSLTKIIKANAPELIAPRTVKRAAAGGGTFTLSRLLHCGTCGGMLTGRHGYKGRAQYYCSRGAGVDHVRTVISEFLILPRVAEEVAKATKLISRRSNKGDPDARAKLAVERERLIDLAQSGLIDKADLTARMKGIAERESKLVSRSLLTITLFPILVGDNADSPANANVALRRMFERIDVDPVTFQPTHFEWTEEMTA